MGLGQVGKGGVQDFLAGAATTAGAALAAGAAALAAAAATAGVAGAAAVALQRQARGIQKRLDQHTVASQQQVWH